MDIKDYKFNVGDKVITTEGVTGKITSICTCEDCTERGFFEPFWVGSDGGVHCISIYDAKCKFPGYYQIGEYRFHDFDKGEVLLEMGHHEKELMRLKKQLQVIETLGVECDHVWEFIDDSYDSFYTVRNYKCSKCGAKSSLSLSI